MRILMVAWGSRGDVVPYVALGRGLVGVGYEVSVAAAKVFEPFVVGAGLGFRPFDIDLTEAGDDPVVSRWLAGPDSVSAELRNMRAAMARFGPVLADGLEAMVSEADGFVSGLLGLDSLAAHAAQVGKPIVSGALAPGQPTRSGQALLYPVRPAAWSRLNRGAGWWQLAGMCSLLRPANSVARRRLGVPVGGLRGYARSVTRTPTVLGASPLVVPQPRDWPDTTVTGYWVDAVPPEYRPPAGLVEFLAAGDPPVYIGFGSMPAKDPEALRSLVVEALTRTKRRAVLGGALHAGDASVLALSDAVVSIAGVPHEWLFPQTAGVVIHGGAGTTGTGLRAGVPVSVVSHMGDQHYWGRRVHDLGAGPKPLRRGNLTADSLAGILTDLALPASRQKARQIGRRLRAENGVAHAVDVISRVFG
jgi:UDP:flavonoid glycosyltransferase YjiC (YdhE family)